MGHKCNGSLTQNQRPYFYVEVEPEVDHIPSCFRVVLAIMMIIALPLVIIVLVITFAGSLVVGLVGGLVILPGYLLYHN